MSGVRLTPTREYLKLLVLAAALGVPAGLAGTAFSSLVHGAEHALWHSIPDQLGLDDRPWWYVIGVTTLGAVGVCVAFQLPGKGGHSAVQGVAVDPEPLAWVPGSLVAAFATLSCGVVLGPEAPLIVIGLAAGVVAARMAAIDAPEPQRVIAFTGAVAAIAVVLGGPLVAAVMMLELIAAKGVVPAERLTWLLVPGFVASGMGALVSLGVGDWPGVSTTALSLPDLPPYSTVQMADVVWAVPVGLAVALLVRVVQGGALALSRVAAARAEAIVLAGGVAVGAVAVAFRAATDEPVDLVLFSGQSSMDDLVVLSSGTLAFMVAAKALAYGISLGAGFRGGPVFPAITIGAAVGALAGDVLPGMTLTGGMVAGVAAGGASALTLPLFGALMATLLVGSSALDASPIAILASVAAWLLSLALEDHFASSVQPEPEAPPAATVER